MKTYLKVFVNFKQNNWARLILIAKFTSNNTKNANTGYNLFELNCDYHLCISYEEDIDSCFISKLPDDLASKLRKLMALYLENFQHTQKFQKQVHNKGTKPRSCASNDKVWLNSKYIKTKQNQKLEVSFWNRFKSYIRYRSKFLSLNYQKSGGFIIFSMCYC